VTSSDSSETENPPGLTRRAIQAFDILASKEQALGLAVSGGSDSTALLVLAADWAREHNKRVQVATVDHGLRPEAAEEAAGVALLCEKLGLPHVTLHWRREKTSPVAQAEARRARHALLAVWAGDKHLRTLALGHTRDDRIETFLMRARQGSGWRGLAGPLPSGPSPVWPEGRGLRLIRPLLAFGREELRAELGQRGQGWVEDPSNQSDRFERVRMRTLAGRMDGQTLLQTLRVMDGLAHMRAAVMAEARSALALVATNDSAAHISLEHLRSTGMEARLRLLEALLMAIGGSESPPRSEALRRLVDLIVHSVGLSGGVTLAGAWIKRDEKDLTLQQAPARRSEPPKSGPAWDRAQALLADPLTQSLAV
jgi:tRNA(Ile)-lysidine synthase